MGRINVIGGSGFIGSRLCRSLHDGDADFSILDIEDSSVFPEKRQACDVRALEDLRAHIQDGDVLINLAAVHRDDVRPKTLYDDVNVTGAKNICQVAREKNVQTIIFASSVAVYGFAPPDTDEKGEIDYFNDYGRTKWLAENVFRAWYGEDPENRTLVIVRPTVVFGEQNRGNVYNLLRQIASGRFLMIGHGKNVKSMAYVENVAAFLQFSLDITGGYHVYNYVDKPDLDMNHLVQTVRGQLTQGRKKGVGLRLPYICGWLAGGVFDVAARLSGKTFPISRIRVKKFCSTTQFASAAHDTAFKAPVSLEEGLQRTVQYEFLENHDDAHRFYSE